MSEFLPWVIVDIDVSAPPTDLDCAPAKQGILLYFWWKGVPLAHSYVQKRRLPLSSDELRLETIESIKRVVAYYSDVHNPPEKSATGLTTLRATNPIAVLDELASFSTRTTPATVSVVICTRDRPDHLANCLDSLLSLVVQPDEVIVVDNASTSDATRQVALKHGKVKYIRENRPGLDVARNTGFQAAESELVAFVDDDVVIEPNWLSGIQIGFQDPEVAAVTGLVLAAELETEAQSTFERNWPFNRGYLPKTYDASYYAATKPYGTPAWDIGAGANMAFRRSVFDKIGPFDERLDVGAAGCSGDSEYWYRILAAGMTIRYEPRAVVRHFHRRENEGLRKQLFHYMRGHTAALLVQYERGRGKGNLRRLFVSLPAYYFRLWLRGLRRGRTPRHAFLGVEIAGGLSGIRYYLKNRTV